ncbi:hypothetical protein AVEN_22418-1 [Araneus ventricosus]|uniref:Uncharacterized protein n=1 Tax=Araneus ventricosus TaxID=182803 RepID=A0A4Y2GLS9_ARAVE|nr:hypothetical protein AVEN_22418-1 [Araneus ventricosus]
MHSILDIQRGIGEMRDVLLAVYAFQPKFEPTRCFIRSFLDSMIQMRWLMMERIFSSEHRRFGYSTPPLLFSDDRETACAFHVEVGCTAPSL